ncbi:MAG: CHRD domain-containing protein [Deltaproteobacteria bacterium]|nr:CHRD domain-containing protein [Nitrososphaeraceae archaeon]
MNKNKKSYCIPTIFFSVGLVTLLILSGSKILALGQMQSEENPKDNSNINKNYNATLTGNQQVPPVKTNGIGSASFELLDDNKTLHYQINVLDVPKITEIHIHQGKSGENGDVIVNIYNSKENIFQNKNETKMSQIESSSVTINGNTQSSLISSGTINNSDLKGPLLGKNISDLITLIQSKNTYVNVHSESYPDGEIRGQIM